MPTEAAPHAISFCAFIRTVSSSLEHLSIDTEIRETVPCKAQFGKDKKYIHQEDLESDLLARIGSVAPMSEKVIDVLSQALKESHSEEIELHETQTRNINNQLERIRQRMKNMYLDKIDERISGDFYDEQISQFEEEKEALLHSLKKLEADNTEYYRVGFMIHEIALRAREIYLNEKASIEERRMLLAYAFSNITVLAGNIKAEYTKPFAFLAEWMPRVNQVLELEKSLGTKGKESTFVPSHPIVLPLLDEFRTLNWAKIKKDIEFNRIFEVFPIISTFKN